MATTDLPPAQATALVRTVINALTVRLAAGGTVTFPGVCTLTLHPHLASSDPNG